jgi:hypothetical protein
MTTSDFVSLQRPDGSFSQSAELLPSVGAFFTSNDSVVGADFGTSFAKEFGIENLAIKDRHYRLYQRILFDFDNDQFEILLNECKFFSDPLAISLLLRQFGHPSHPHGFFALDVWDTCYAAWRLLLEDNVDAASRCVLWILDQQKASGGWACSTQYPLEDSDTTAAILILLDKFQYLSGTSLAVEKGFNWLEKLETIEGPVKTFDEDFGIPSSDTTAATLVARKIWKLSISPKALRWLDNNSGSYWYTSDSRIASCLRYLGSIDTQNRIPAWGMAMNEKGYNIKFMGGVFLRSSLWNDLIREVPNSSKEQSLEMIA